MPGISGVEATRQITGRPSPGARARSLDQDNDVLDAILAGACGYLLKDSSIQELMAGIRAIDWRVADLAAHRLEGASEGALDQQRARDRGVIRAGSRTARSRS